MATNFSLLSVCKYFFSICIRLAVAFQVVRSHKCLVGAIQCKINFKWACKQTWANERIILHEQNWQPRNLGGFMYSWILWFFTIKSVMTFACIRKCPSWTTEGFANMRNILKAFAQIISPYPAIATNFTLKQFDLFKEP